jgi:hypothetical protein
LGNELNLLERSLSPNALAPFFYSRANSLRALMATDNAFIVAYSAAFVGIAAYLLPRARWLAVVALSFALLTSLSDLTENTMTLSFITIAEEFVMRLAAHQQRDENTVTSPSPSPYRALK